LVYVRFAISERLLTSDHNVSGGSLAVTTAVESRFVFSFAESVAHRYQLYHCSSTEDLNPTMLRRVTNELSHQPEHP
jgi:hypothetical protein